MHTLDREGLSLPGAPASPYQVPCWTPVCTHIFSQRTTSHGSIIMRKNRIQILVSKSFKKKNRTYWYIISIYMHIFISLDIIPWRYRTCANQSKAYKACRDAPVCKGTLTLHQATHDSQVSKFSTDHLLEYSCNAGSIKCNLSSVHSENRRSSVVKPMALRWIALDPHVYSNIYMSRTRHVDFCCIWLNTEQPSAVYPRCLGLDLDLPLLHSRLVA